MALAALHDRGICHGDRLKDASNVLSLLITTSDFGQAFEVSEPPAVFSIPANYAAPEIVLDGSGGVTMDARSLGRTLYEIRLGRRLFDVPQIIDLHKEDYVCELASLLEEPPQVWVNYYVELDDGSNTGSTPYTSLVRDSGEPCTEPQTKRARSIQEKLAECHDCSGEDCAHPRFKLISEAEAASLAVLLERFLRWRPEKRLRARDVLGHAWFHTRY